MTWRLWLDQKRAMKYYTSLPEKSRKIVKDKLKELSVDPYPGNNKECLKLKRNKKYYRLHISRSFTAYYTINEEKKMVCVLEILTTEQAHKKYGHLGR